MGWLGAPRIPRIGHAGAGHLSPEGKEERRELFLGQSERQFSVVRGRVFPFSWHPRRGGYFSQNLKAKEKRRSASFFPPLEKTLHVFLPGPLKWGLVFPHGKEPPPKGGSFFSPAKTAGLPRRDFSSAARLASPPGEAFFSQKIFGLPSGQAFFFAEIFGSR